MPFSLNRAVLGAFNYLCNLIHYSCVDRLACHNTLLKLSIRTDSREIEMTIDCRNLFLTYSTVTVIITNHLILRNLDIDKNFATVRYFKILVQKPQNDDLVTIFCELEIVL